MKGGSDDPHNRQRPSLKENLIEDPTTEPQFPVSLTMVFGAISLWLVGIGLVILAVVGIFRHFLK